MNSLHKYTLIGLCIVLLQVAIVHCEIPSDWSARVDTFNALYSPDDLKLLIDLVSSLFVNTLKIINI